MSATITIKARPEQKKRLVRAAKRAGKSLSAYMLEVASAAGAKAVARPDYGRQAREFHGERYLALRLADALEK